MKTIATTIAALTMTLGMTAGDVRAADHHTIDELSYSLMQQAAAATREVRFGFRHSPHYRHLNQDVRDIYAAAKHIHDVAHVAGSRTHILKDIEEIDELVHHVEELLLQASAGEGHLHSTHRGRGYIFHSSSTYHERRLQAMVHRIADTVHALQDAVGFSRPGGPAFNGQPAIVPPSQNFPSQNFRSRYPVSRGGFEIRRGNNGRVSFSLRLP